MGQQTKDFLALTHGQEWVNFYESFDKLVQDNLARSSELLRRAMTLPEVADREVAQLRTELESKLQVEQDRHKALLGQLGADITASHDQVSTLAIALGGVIGDLDRLSQRVTEALASFDQIERVQDSIVDALPGGPISNGVASNGHGSDELRESSLSVSWPDSPVELASPQEGDADSAPADESADDSMLEIQNAVEAMELPVIDSDIAIDLEPFSFDPTAVADAQGEPLEASDLAADAAAIDLNALAEAEAAEGESPADVADSAASGERPRPHWLSVTRVGART